MQEIRSSEVNETKAPEVENLHKFAATDSGQPGG